MGIDSYVQLMLHFNGVDASTSFPDDSGHSRTVTGAGTAQIDTAQSKFGGASLLCDGNSDYVTVNDFAELDMGSADFTYDFWVKFNSTAGSQGFFTRYESASSYFYLALETGNLRFRDYNADTVNFSRAYTFNTTDWFHIAVVRFGNIVRLFVNGTQQGADVACSGTFTARSSNLLIGAFTQANYWMNGWIDEFRYSPGVARWTDGGTGGVNYFTPPVSEYSASNDITVAPDALSLSVSLPAPTIQISKTVSISALSITASLLVPTVTAGTLFQASALALTSSLLSPSLIISSTIHPAALSLTAVLKAPHVEGDNTLRDATKIISFNPLVIITEENPLKIAKVDVTIPSAPIVQTYIYPGVSDAQDAVYDSTFGKIYVACGLGKILEIDITDFTSFTIYNTGITNNFNFINLLPNYQLIYGASNYSLGEIVTMDISTKELMALDMRFSAFVSQLMNTQVNTVNGALIDFDFRWAALAAKIFGTDIRFTPIAPGQEEIAISRLDFHVFIDNVEATDIKMDAITVYHTDYEKSRATVTLARKHDNLDYTLENVLSQITNQNALRVEINGHVEFDGFIWDIDCKSETEDVVLTAYTELPKGNERSHVTFSLPSINEQLHLGHALVHNPKIEAPKLLTDDFNPDIYTGVIMDMGFYEVQNISRWSSFQNSADVAAQVSAGTLLPKQNWTYFWFATAHNFITGAQWATLNYIGTSPSALTSDTFEITGMAYKYQREFLAKKQRLGNGIVYVNDFKFVSLAPAQAIYDALKTQNYIDNSGNILQHFKDAVVGYDVNFVPVVFDLKLFMPNTNITSSTLNSNVMGIVDGKLGYTLGVAPFKNVSSKTGRLITSDKWQDKPDGLYVHRDAYYNYVNVNSPSDPLPLDSYLAQVAALEFKKIQNINGTVLPKTSCDIEIFIDAYYINNIQLLKRINIDNTTRPNIYKNNNGFPVSVKSIEISSNTMKVTLHCDNQWSRTEMLEIESQYPNPDDILYSFPETNARAFAKFDVKALKEVQ